jgi:hypothetical protein
MRIVGLVALAIACNSPDARFDLAPGGAGGAGGAGASGGSGGGDNPELDALWALRLGGPGDQLGTALAPRADDVLVAANLAGTMTLGTETLTSAGSDDVLYFSLSASDGGYLWHRQDGDAALQQIFGIATSKQNNEIALAGAFTGALFGQNAGQQDMFTARANAAGDVQWVRPKSSRECLDAAIDDVGTWIAVGTFDAYVDFPPGFDTIGGRDGVVQWHSANNGGTTRARRVGSPGDDVLEAVATDGASQVFVGAWRANGDLAYARTFGDAAPQQGHDVAVDRERNELVVVGDFEGSITFDAVTLTSEGGRDVFVVRLDEAGAVLSARSFGGPNDQTAAAVAIDGIGRVVVAGDFEDTMTFGGASLVSAGKSDVFLVRLLDDEVEQLSRFGDAETQRAADVVVGESDTLYLLLNAQGDVTIGETPLTQSDLSYDLVLAKFAP